MIFANGDLSSFEVTLAARRRRATSARIYTDEQTNIRLLLPGETEPRGTAARARRNADEPSAATSTRLHAARSADRARHRGDVGRAPCSAPITSSASNVIYLKDKTLAEWVALNRLTEIRIAQQMPAKGKRTGNAEMGGMRWQWEEEVTELPDQGNVPHRGARAPHRRDGRRHAARRASRRRRPLTPSTSSGSRLDKTRLDHDGDRRRRQRASDRRDACGTCATRRPRRSNGNPGGNPSSPAARVAGNPGSALRAIRPRPARRIS